MQDKEQIKKIRQFLLSLGFPEKELCKTEGQKKEEKKSIKK